jgi:hypothetical protein
MTEAISFGGQRQSRPLEMGRGKHPPPEAIATVLSPGAMSSFFGFTQRERSDINSSPHLCIRSRRRSE